MAPLPDPVSALRGLFTIGGQSVADLLVRL
jgi:hypothetical protein